MIKQEQNEQAVKASLISIWGNLILAILKGVTGFVGNSFALIADAIESTTDIFSSILVLFGIKYAARPADDNHPYGHGRAEALVTVAVVIFLVLSASIIAYESIINIQVPHKPPKPYTLIVLGCIIIFKEIMYRIVKRKGQESNSSAVQADAWHHRSDAITSVCAFIGISIAIWKGPGYESADDWAALVASIIIYYNAYKIFRPALGEIMDEHVHDNIVHEIEIIAKHTPGVIDIEKCYVRKTGFHYIVDLHMKVDGKLTVTEGHDIAHLLKANIQKEMPQILSVHIHTEPAHTRA